MRLWHGSSYTSPQAEMAAAKEKALHAQGLYRFKSSRLDQ